MSGIDPRPAVIGRRLEPVRKILAVTGGKGGIGKSLIASTLALVLAEDGRAGLLDLDLTGPCDHILLGTRDSFPEEDFGVEPRVVANLHFMSVSLFCGSNAAPLRGVDVTNALIELLAITNWPELEVLVIDLPPGLGDATLDVVRLLPRAEYLAVATASRVVLETVARTLQFHRGLGSRVAGVLENMGRGDSSAVEKLAARVEVPFVGSVPLDPTVEAATGDTGRLGRTRVASALRRLQPTLVPGRA